METRTLIATCTKNGFGVWPKVFKSEEKELFFTGLGPQDIVDGLEEGSSYRLEYETGDITREALDASVASIKNGTVTELSTK